MPAEPEHMDVLQNIEFAVNTAFGLHPDMTDYAVQRVYEALIELYSAEVVKRQPRPHNLNESEFELFQQVKAFCELRLGRNQELATYTEGEEISTDSITPSEMVTCLKRLVRSVQKWTRHHGRQGYLKFISQFIA